MVSLKQKCAQPRRLKVVYFMDKPHEIDGSAQIMLGYASRLWQINCQPTVVFIHPFSKDNQYFYQLRQRGISVFSLTHSYMFYVIRCARVLRNILNLAVPKIGFITWDDTIELFLSYYFKWKKTDIVHVFRSDKGMPLAIKAGYRANIPVLYHEMGIPRFKENDDLHFQKLAKVLPLCASVAGLSQTLSLMLADCVPTNINSYVIPLIWENAAGFERQMSNERGVVHIGFVGRLEKLKGAVDLIEAFFLAKENLHCPAKLILAGDGPELESLKLRAKELGCGDLIEIRQPYLGEKEKEEYYRNIDILVLPSYSEGTPNCIIEAMSFGIPVIAYPVGGVPDVIPKDIGFLVDTGDICELASAIAKLVNNERQRQQLGIRSREHVKMVFSGSRVLPILREIYERILSVNNDPAAN